MKQFMLTALAVSTLTACAPGPSAVAPTPMGNAFAAVPCQQAQNMLIEERQRVATLSRKQSNAAIGDAIGVFLILVPVSSLTGSDVEGELAASKGKVLALENRMAGC
jgi:hypothetical protein